MSSSPIVDHRHVGGGLRFAPADRARPFRACLRDGADVSWLSRCRPGDNQGAVGACAIFAMANWAEIMHGYDISDKECLTLYSRTCSELGQGDDGLTFRQAFEAAHRANWLPGARQIEAVWDLSDLASQPILAGYTVTPAWDRPNSAGCLDHAAARTNLGGHATVIVGFGIVHSVTDLGPLVYVENSWGRAWGWNGICVMTEALHRLMCNELWVIR